MALERVDKDFYPTESRLTKALLDRCAFIQHGTTVLEPCAGERDIVRVLEDRGFDVEHTDIQDEPPKFVASRGPLFEREPTLDATLPEYWEVRKDCDWVITNPPFAIIDEFIPMAVKKARYGAALLLRLTSQEPTEGRRNWLKKYADNLRRVLTFGSPRPSFRSDTKSTDSVTTAWYVWDKQWSWNERGIESPFEYIVGN